MKYLINEIDEVKKFDSLLNTYIEIVNKNGSKSKSVMVIVPNNNKRMRIERRLKLNLSEEININTYIGFIKKELVKYWPIVMGKCNKIKKQFVSPVFISNSLAEYIITKEVDKKRNMEGYFEDLTGTTRSIAKSIINNINKAAFNLIDFETIGEKIYLSKKNKDTLRRFPYTQMDEIISYYTNILLENSMLDNSLSVYLYNHYLLNDKIYIEKLKEETKYLIVDSLENSSIAECEFIKMISDTSKDTYVYFNKTRDFSVFNNIDIKYIEENIIKNIDRSMNIDNYVHKNGEIESVKIEDIYILPAKIHLNQNSQLYSEMVEKVYEKVLDLVNCEISLKDVAIITPINSTILDYSLEKMLIKSNISIFNTKKDRKIIDYPYANTLVVAACIFYDYPELIKEEDYISFIEIILNVNKIQARRIFKNKEKKAIEYQNIIDYIKEKRKNNLNINEFLIQFYIDKMLNLTNGKLNVSICKKIIQESETFTENISLLGIDKNTEKEKIFIEALKTTINDFYTTKEVEDLKEEDKIVLTTPYSYIATNMNRPIQIWVDIGSNAWNMKIEKDISNMVVLRKSFKEKKVYTDDIEDYYKKYYLYNTIYNLLINAKEVYAYKSEYTVNGYMQESMLYSILLKIIEF